VRIVYLIMTHRLPRQVTRLSGVLRRGSPTAEIVVHHDSGSPPLDRRSLDALDVELVQPALAVEWGGMPFLEAQLHSLRWLSRRSAFDWVVVISGQDYPVAPVAEIESRLAATDADALIEAVPCPAPAGRPIDEFALRYHFQWRPLPGRLSAPARHLARALNGRLWVRSTPRSGTSVGLRARRTPFSAAFPCYRGSDWFSLSSRAVDTLLDPGSGHAQLLRHYRRTLLPSESFPQTVLANDDRLRLSSDTRRYTRWDAPHATGPALLRRGDLDAVLGSGLDFARKFDEEVDSGVLDEIDRRVHLPPS
jgi:Core-2/I-Branching enzyme